MTLDPTTRYVVDAMADAFPDVHAMSPAEARRAIAASQPEVIPEPVHQVSDRTVEGPGGPVRVRVYRPAEGLLGAVVFLHGGGWVLCDLETHDGTCRSMANGTGAVVVSVDYRLAPEHPYPAPLDDAAAVLAWVVEQAAELGVDPGRLAVAGDSAGGNLAAALCLRARDEGGPPIAFQLLVYPVLAPDFDRASYVENAEGYFLTAADMRWYWDQYVPDHGARDQAHVSPLVAEDLHGLPAAHIVTAEHDPLRDEGEAYASRLRAAGVPVTNVRYGGMFHGFFSLGFVLPAAEQATRTAHAALARALAPPD